MAALDSFHVRFSNCNIIWLYVTLVFDLNEFSVYISPLFVVAAVAAVSILLCPVCRWVGGFG